MRIQARPQGVCFSLNPVLETLRWIFIIRKKSLSIYIRWSPLGSGIKRTSPFLNQIKLSKYIVGTCAMAGRFALIPANHSVVRGSGRRYAQSNARRVQFTLHAWIRALRLGYCRSELDFARACHKTSQKSQRQHDCSKRGQIDATRLRRGRVHVHRWARRQRTTDQHHFFL